MSTSSAQLSFLSLAQNVFDEQVLRWDTDNCAGGLRWQIFSFNNGYNYKNTLSNGQFFELAARLARFTGNATYADWASKSYAWAENVGLIGGDGSVFDGAYVTQNCSDISKVQWTASAGVFLHGSAVMYNLVWLPLGIGIVIESNQMPRLRATSPGRTEHHQFSLILRMSSSTIKSSTRLLARQMANVTLMSTSTKANWRVT
jgi:hypothetical protein